MKPEISLQDLLFGVDRLRDRVPGHSAPGMGSQTRLSTPNLELCPHRSHAPHPHAELLGQRDQKDDPFTLYKWIPAWER